jgi:hypothetical protein
MASPCNRIGSQCLFKSLCHFEQADRPKRATDLEVNLQRVSCLHPVGCAGLWALFFSNLNEGWMRSRDALGIWMCAIFIMN